ncbi:patatin-like phospholipase family protein [Catenulispora yoronensis]
MSTSAVSAISTVPAAAPGTPTASATPRWPERRLVVVAVDAATGRTALFDRDSGVPLVDALTASCALPGAWPPATIGAARYLDGAIRTMTNADLAAGHDRVLVIAPMAALDRDLDGQVQTLRGKVGVLSPDEAALRAFGPDPLAAGTRAAGAEAGYAHGTAWADEAAAVWA